jgi:hypothetical protein
VPGNYHGHWPEIGSLLLIRTQVAAQSGLMLLNFWTVASDQCNHTHGNHGSPGQALAALYYHHHHHLDLRSRVQSDRLWRSELNRDPYKVSANLLLPLPPPPLLHVSE